MKSAATNRTIRSAGQQSLRFCHIMGTRSAPANAAGRRSANSDCPQIVDQKCMSSTQSGGCSNADRQWNCTISTTPARAISAVLASSYHNPFPPMSHRRTENANRVRMVIHEVVGGQHPAP